MNRYQAMVEEFHELFEQPRAKKPGIGPGFPLELRTHLIREEAEETCRALERGDVVEVLDGICDLLYVVYGTACAMNIDLDPFFEEVHRTNMAKVGSDGKPVFKFVKTGNGELIEKRVGKPPGWTPPDIEGILLRSDVGTRGS